MNEQDKDEFDVEAHKAGLEGDDLAEDVEGHKMKQGLIDDEDVEGHRVRDSLIKDDEDVEGHRYLGVQPPRDTDLGGTDR